MRFSRRTLCAALSATAVAVAIPAAWRPARAAHHEADRARALIESLGREGVALLTDRSLPRGVWIARFRGLVSRYFALDAIGRWVLGRHWRRATPAEREIYLGLFEDLIVYGYAERFGEYAGETLEVERAVVDSADTVTVFSHVVRAETGDRLGVDWRVAHTDDTYRIVDILVGGTSLSHTMRSDFASTVRQSGGNVDGLIGVLRDKVAALKADNGG